MRGNVRLYRAGRLTLSSAIALPELPAVANGAPDWVVELRRAPLVWTARPRVFHRWTAPSGGAWLTLGRAGADYHLRFARTVSFAIHARERRIVCRPDPGVPRVTLRHLLLDQVVPLVLSTGPLLVLHASAVSTPRGAVVFVGPSGHGKSTLAASLALSGWPLLTDDSVALGVDGGAVRVWPADSGARLWPDSLSALVGPERRSTRAVAHYTSKRRLAVQTAAALSGDAQPLRRVYVLAPPAEMKRSPMVTSTPVAPRDAMVALIRHAFHLDVEDRTALERTFELAARAAGSVAVHRLAYPWTLARLDEVRRAVEADVSG